VEIRKFFLASVRAGVYDACLSRPSLR